MKLPALALLAPAVLLLAFAAPVEAGGSGYWKNDHPAHASGYGRHQAAGYRHGPRHYGSRHLAPRHWSYQRGYSNGHRDGHRKGYRSRAYGHGPRYGVYRQHPRGHAYRRHSGYRSHGYYKPYPRHRGYRSAYGYSGVYLPPVWFGGVSLHFGY